MPLRPREAAYQPNRKNTTCETVTAFIDLLGLSNALVRLDRIKAENLSKEAATLLVQQSKGAVQALRRNFEEYYALYDSFPRPQTTDKRVLELWDKSNRGESRLYWFSDCASINIILDNKNLPAMGREILALISGLAYCTVGLAAEGQLIRGGIEMGFAIDSGTEEVLGSGLVHAYGLETGVAVHPRVCLGTRFMGFLDYLGSNQASDAVQSQPDERKLLTEYLTLIRNLIAVDRDGVRRIDFASPQVTAHFDSAPPPRLLDRAHSAITRKLEELDPVRDAKVFAKYAWMLNTLSEHRAN